MSALATPKNNAASQLLQIDNKKMLASTGVANKPDGLAFFCFIFPRHSRHHDRSLCISESFIFFRFFTPDPPSPKSDAPWIDAATAAPTMQSSQWLS